MCDCIANIEKQMSDEYNTAFDKVFTVDKVTREWKTEIKIAVKKIKPRGRKPINIMINYCPFCGEKRERSEGENDPKTKRSS